MSEAQDDISAIQQFNRGIRLAEHHDEKASSAHRQVRQPEQERLDPGALPSAPVVPRTAQQTNIPPIASATNRKDQPMFTNNAALTAKGTPSRTIPQESLKAITSVIGADVLFSGNFESESKDAGLRLEGRFEGAINMKVGGVIHIAPGSSVNKGTLVADHIFVEGRVEGSIHARKTLEITGTGVVCGSVRYDADLDIHKSGRLRANVEFSGDIDAAVDEAQNTSVIAMPARIGT